MPSSDTQTPVWFITGCSTGLGRALAERVLSHGHRCVVTARDVAQIQPVAAPYPDRALALYSSGYYYEARRKGLLGQLRTARSEEPPQ